MPKEHSAPSKKGHKPYDSTKRKLALVSSQDDPHTSSHDARPKHKKNKDRNGQSKPSHPFATAFVDPNVPGPAPSEAVTASGSMHHPSAPIKRLASLEDSTRHSLEEMDAFQVVHSSPVKDSQKGKPSKKRRRDRRRQSLAQGADEASRGAHGIHTPSQRSATGDEPAAPSSALPHVAHTVDSQPERAASPAFSTKTPTETDMFAHDAAAGARSTPTSRLSNSPDKLKAEKSGLSSHANATSSNAAALDKQRRKEEAQEAILARSLQQAREDARREAQQEMENEMAEMRRKIQELEAKVQEKEREVGEQIKAVEAGRATVESHESILEQLKDATVCRVCFEHLNDPHILSCGHIACKSCLQTWFRTPGAYLREHPDPLPADQDLSYHTKVCHVCRTYIVNRPARVYFAKNILEPLGFDAHIPTASQIEQAKAAAVAPGQHHPDQAENDPWSGMFPPDVDTYKLWDESDQIFRCNGCCSEVADGTCEGCGREFSVADPEEIPGIWAAGGDGEEGGDEEMEGNGSDGYEVMDEREGMFGMAPAATVPRRGRIVVDDEDDEEESDEDDEEGSMADFIDRDDEEDEEDEEVGSDDGNGTEDRASRRERGEDDHDDSGSSASDESGERYDIGPRTGAFAEAMSAARQGRADRFRQRREASDGEPPIPSRIRNHRQGPSRRDVPVGLAGMLDLMADESDDGNLTDEGGVHEDDMVGLRGDYPGFSDLEEDGDDLRSESDVDDRTEEEYEDSFIDDGEDEDEAEEGSDELDSGEESEASLRQNKKGKRSKKADVEAIDDEEKSEEESDAPSIGELRRRRLKNLDGGFGAASRQAAGDDESANPTRRPNRPGSSRRAIIISDDEE